MYSRAVLNINLHELFWERGGACGQGEGKGEKNLGMHTHSALASAADKATAIPEIIP